MKPQEQYVAPAPQYSAPAPQYSAPAPQYSTPAPQYVAPAPQYSAPQPQYVAPVAPVNPAPPAPTPQRVEPDYNVSPQAYSAPKFTERTEPVQPDAPKKYTVRPREKEFFPRDNIDAPGDRNSFARPAQPRLPSPDDFADERRDPGRKPKLKRQYSKDDLAEDHADLPRAKPYGKGPSPYLKSTPSSTCAHRVAAGETISSIAYQHFGYGGPRSVARIAAVNPGINPDRIYVGQIVYLPCACNVQTPVQPEPEAAIYRRSESNRLSRSGHGDVEYIPVSAL